MQERVCPSRGEGVQAYSNASLQSQKAVAAYFSSKQLLPFGNSTHQCGNNDGPAAMFILPSNRLLLRFRGLECPVIEDRIPYVIKQNYW